MNFLSFPHYRLRITYTVARMLKFSSYPGTSINGILGHAVMRVSPAAFAAIFRVPAPDDFEMKRKMPFLPSPLLVKPPLQPKEIYYEGDEYSFDLVLVGQSINWLHDLLDSLVEVEKRAVGDRSVSPRGKLRLKNVEYYETPEKLHPLFAAAQLKPLLLPNLGDQSVERGVQIKCLTPLNLGVCELPNKLPFSLLSKRMLHRVENLRQSYAPDFAWDAAECEHLLQAAEQIRTHRLNFVPRDVKHSRRKTYTAFLGKAEFRGEMRPYIPLLQLCEQIHIGSNTSAGLGAILCF